MVYTRRDIGKIALAALAVPSVFPRALSAQIRDAKIHGVTVGSQTYSFRSINNPATRIIAAMKELGLFEAELMSGDAENLAGMPALPTVARAGGGAPPAPAPPAGAPASAAPAAGAAPAAARGRGPALTPEQEAARAAAVEAQRKWRLSTSPATWAAVRKQFNDAGIDVRLLCYNMGTTMADEMIDYGFQMAKGLGVRAISTSTQVSTSKRIAPFADKYQIMVGVHGHANVDRPDEISTEATFLAAMANSKYIGANLDIGHYTVANGDSVAFIKKHYARITNLHLKDRKRDGGANVPMGEGDVPIKEVLQTLKQGKWDIAANLEFEHPGDPMVEIPKSLAYIRAALA